MTRPCFMCYEYGHIASCALKCLFWTSWLSRDKRQRHLTQQDVDFKCLTWWKIVIWPVDGISLVPVFYHSFSNNDWWQKWRKRVSIESASKNRWTSNTRKSIQIISDHNENENPPFVAGQFFSPFFGRPTSVATIAAVGATILFHMEVWSYTWGVAQSL